MKKFLKIISILILIFAMIGTVSLTGAADNGFRAGDIIEYGTYPQSDVTETLGGILNAQGGLWKSYNYYSGSGENWGGDMKPSDYMRYKDVLYNGDKYRGVTFDSYRPHSTGSESLPEGITNQSEHSYYTGKIYWFKYEPIKWRVLDPETGFVMCDSIIDSQAFNNYAIESKTVKDSHKIFYVVWGDPEGTYYSNNYAESSIRQWLNDDFYNTAFSEEQKANIKTTVMNNDCWQTLNGEMSYNDYDAPSTADKVFLLSYDEVENKNYGFNLTEPLFDPARRLSGSDYADCQGLNLISNMDVEDTSYWWLRTPYYYPAHANIVGVDGGTKAGGEVNNTDGGVVPALKLSELKNDLAGSDMNEHSISISGYVPSRIVDYKTTITFSADPVQGPVPDAEVRWFINGNDSGAGETYTVAKAKKSFTVQAKYVKDGKVLAESEFETVKVKTNLFARLIAFFRSIFGKLPKVVQGL